MNREQARLWEKTSEPGMPPMQPLPSTQPITDASALRSSLSALGLLSDADLAESSSFADARELARDLMKRGLLSGTGTNQKFIFIRSM